MWASNDPKWLLIAGPILVGVAGLLFYLHTSDAEVPKPRHWAAEKALYACDDLPDYVSERLDAALELVKDYSEYTARVDTPCPHEVNGIEQCEYNVDGKVYTTFCKNGAVVFALAGGDFDWTKGDHGLHKTLDDGQFVRQTTVFPSVLDLEDADEEGNHLPKDHRLVVVAHSLLHAEGYDHTRTELPGPFVAQQSGSLMHPYIYKAGYGTEGL
jgi:hypothetical protein